MTQKQVDDLSDSKKVQEAGTRGYKREPDPADAPADPPAPETDETVPTGQADGAGMKKVEEKTVEEAGKD